MRNCWSDDLSRFAFDVVLALIQRFRCLLGCLHMLSMYNLRCPFVALTVVFVDYEVCAHADNVTLVFVVIHLSHPPLRSWSVVSQHPSLSQDGLLHSELVFNRCIVFNKQFPLQLLNSTQA